MGKLTIREGKAKHEGAHSESVTNATVNARDDNMDISGSCTRQEKCNSLANWVNAEFSDFLSFVLSRF
jgi:hypothetical protein